MKTRILVMLAVAAVSATAYAGDLCCVLVQLCCTGNLPCC